MIFDLIVVIILVGSVFGGLSIFKLLKALFVIFVIVLVFQFIPANITSVLVKGSKLYGLVKPWAMELKGKINLPAIKLWLTNLGISGGAK